MNKFKQILQSNSSSSGSFEMSGDS